jgi:hypothetical protein
MGAHLARFNYLILLAMNFWCTAKPTITATSVTNKVFPVSLVNIVFLVKDYVNKNKNETIRLTLYILYISIM